MTKFNFAESDSVQNLKALSGKSEFKYDKINPKILEWFTNPANHNSYVVYIDALEFTSLCPKTGQPNYAAIYIKYRPNLKCLESKSLKLYLVGYRQCGMFAEQICNKILSDLVHILEPKAMVVRCDFTPRGGIAFKPIASYGDKI